MAEGISSDVRHARLGILVIHNDPVPETELWALALQRHPGQTVHTARFWTPRASGVEFTGLAVDTLIESTGLGDGIDQLRSLSVDALGYCFASSSVFGGTTFDSEFESRVSLRADCPVVTAGTALRQAFEKLPDAGNVGILVPPWFSDRTVDEVLKYLHPHAWASQVCRFALPSRWEGIERPDLFDLGARHAIDQGEVVRQVVDAFGGRVGTVVIPGGGFASAGAARVLAHEHGIEVVSANLALFEALQRRLQAAAIT